MSRIREIAKAESEGRLIALPCKVGDTVWVIDKDEDGLPYDFSGYVFISALCGFAIVSPSINGSSDVSEILQDQADMYFEGCSCDFNVIPLEDCRFTYEEAEAALGGGGDGI